jgi:predicted metal-dependent HD superfamily phosphohydrolase
VPVDLLSAWPLPDGTDLRDRLLAAYSDEARGYHDTTHLAEVLGRLDELGRHGAAYDRTPVLLAAWFHDAVYDGERDAEERSAAWAETHRPEADDPAGCALSDADLGILAAGTARYAAYVAAVRVDYAHVPDDVFVEGRTAVLRDLLSKPHLFHTAYARETWEAPARANVEAELARLAAP